MTKEQLYEEISTRKSTLLKELTSPTDEYLDFIIKYSEENNLKDPEACLRVNLDDLFFFLMLTLTYPNNLELVKTIHEEKNNLFSTRSVGEIELLIDQLELIYMVLKAQESIGDVDLNDSKSTRAHIKKAIKHGRSMVPEEQMERLANVVILKCLTKENFDEAISLVAKIRNFSLVVEEARKYIGNSFITNEPKLKTHIQDRMVNNSMSDLYKYDNMDKAIYKFNGRLADIKKIHSERVKQKSYQKQKLSTYDHFKTKFNKLLTTDEIIDYKDFVEYLDEDLKVVVLGIINEHNQKYYQDTTESSSSDYLKTCIILNNFGIESSKLTYDEISAFSPDELNEMLTSLKNLGIKKSESLLRIIKVTNKQTIQHLSKYIKKDIIKVDFIENHPIIFDETSPEFMSLITNIKTATNNNISLNYIGQYQEVLLIPPQNLLNSLNTLEDYGLKITTSVSPTLLTEPLLAEKLDTIIELGYEKDLESNLNLATYPISSWQKIVMLAQLGIEIEVEQLENILKTNTFIVEEESIENYLHQPVSQQINNELKALSIPNVLVSNPLEIYAQSRLSYNIGNIIVSRPKVIRNLKKLSSTQTSQEEKLLLSIGNNMYLTHDDFDKLKQMIDPKNVVKPTVLCYNNHHF